MTGPETNETAETSLFTKIIDGDIPGRFVWADDVCVAFATIEPQPPGHVLVVPRIVFDSYVDANDATVAHLSVIAKRIAAAQVRVFDALRPGIVVLGLDVPHLHIHVLPLHEAADIAPSAARAADDAQLDGAMTRLREGLREDGWGQFVPVRMDSPAPEPPLAVLFFSAFVPAPIPAAAAGGWVQFAVIRASRPRLGRRGATTRIGDRLGGVSRCVPTRSARSLADTGAPPAPDACAFTTTEEKALLR